MLIRFGATTRGRTSSCASLERRCSFAPGGHPRASEFVRVAGTPMLIRRGATTLPGAHAVAVTVRAIRRVSGWDGIPSRSLHGEFFNQTGPGLFHPGCPIVSPGCLIGSVHLRALLDVGDTGAQSQGAPVNALSHGRSPACTSKCAAVQSPAEMQWATSRSSAQPQIERFGSDRQSAQPPT